MPKGLQEPRIPIIVGGNGERVTAGYAIRYADELNFVYLSPEQCADRIRAVRARCEVEGRDPATLRFSLYTRDEEARDAGQARVDLIGQLRDAGLGPDHLLCGPLVADSRDASRVRRRLSGGGVAWAPDG